MFQESNTFLKETMNLIDQSNSSNYSIVSILDQDSPLDLSIKSENETIIKENSNLNVNFSNNNNNNNNFINSNRNCLNFSNNLNIMESANQIMQRLKVMEENCQERSRDWIQNSNSSSNTNNTFPPLLPPHLYPLWRMMTTTGNGNSNITNIFHQQQNYFNNYSSQLNYSMQKIPPHHHLSHHHHHHHHNNHHYSQQNKQSHNTILSLSPSSCKKRKRTKVTDSRLLRRTHMMIDSTPQCSEEQGNDNVSIVGASTPSSGSSVNEEQSIDPKKYTLTPVHLRKAKLMFLYTRYPNSQMLKSFFPDIVFYKQNTAQLVKWFSNFREFYYSEMEKAVQRYLSGGIKYSSELIVTEDSELFKNLMTHFNKNRQIEVPKEFLMCVQVTLKEFYDAISVGKNLHQSWKKPIYKNIAKLDQPLPEFFRDLSWMMELARDDNTIHHTTNNNGHNLPAAGAAMTTTTNEARRHSISCMNA